MRKQSHLSSYELMTMLAVLRLGREAYGVPISREIESRGGREIALSGIYAALERLEERGLVTSELGESTAQRGGRAKTYFKLTAKGVREVRSAQLVLTSLWDGLPGLEGRVG